MIFLIMQQTLQKHFLIIIRVISFKNGMSTFPDIENNEQLHSKISRWNEYAMEVIFIWIVICLCILVVDKKMETFSVLDILSNIFTNVSRNILVLWGSEKNICIHRVHWKKNV